MGFIMEFAENLILRLMEDPVERDRKFREHVMPRKRGPRRYWRCGAIQCVPMVFGHLIGTTLSYFGALKSAKSLAVVIPMMTSFRTVLPPPPPKLPPSLTDFGDIGGGGIGGRTDELFTCVWLTILLNSHCSQTQEELPKKVEASPHQLLM